MRPWHKCFAPDAMPFCFLGATPLCGVGLSAPIPQPPCGRLAGFPLQSLAQLPREIIAHALLKARHKAVGILATVKHAPSMPNAFGTAVGALALG
jgi:hypothetical protein